MTFAHLFLGLFFIPFSSGRDQSRLFLPAQPSLPREVLIFFSTPKLIAQRSQRAGWNEGTRVQYGFLSNNWVQRPGLRLSRAGKRCECNRRRFLLRTH